MRRTPTKALLVTLVALITVGAIATHRSKHTSPQTTSVALSWAAIPYDLVPSNEPMSIPFDLPTTTTTTVAPPPPPPPERVIRPEPSRSVAASTTPVVIPTGDAWERLRNCESGGDYTENTGNGYYGAYQFSFGTWNTMGTGFSRADLAPPEVQDDAARRLQAQSGWGQWPACSRKLGLL